MSNSEQPSQICEDFLVFQDTLKRMRELDDNIIYAINKITVRTEEKVAMDNCQQLWKQIASNYSNRESTIRGCISYETQRLANMRDEREKTSQDDPRWAGRLRAQQVQLRMFRNELNVEEIIRERTNKAFNERCRRVFSIPN